MNLEIRNNMYQKLNLIVDGRTQIIPAKTKMVIGTTVLTEQMKDLKTSGFISIKEIN